jgi:subtilisin family serine protease
MAEIGPLLQIVQHACADFSVGEFLGLARPPLPAHLDVIDDRLAVNLMATADENGGWERTLESLLAHGFRLRTRAPRGASGWAYIDEIAELSKADDRAYVEAAYTVSPELDVSVPEAMNAAPGAGTPGWTGRGVIIGIIDTGIDVTHASLRTASGATRVVRLWDQSMQGAATSPPEFSYGSEWTAADIDAHLAAGTSFPSIDRTGHGTAVAGIAAANGLAAPATRYVGVAPEAELVVVVLDARAHAFASGDMVVDAVDYIHAVTRGKRAVVNISQGGRLGPHDGHGDLDLDLADRLRQDANRIVVTSAGNLGDAGAHARVVVPPEGSVDLDIDVPTYTGPYLAVELWYDLRDRIKIELLDPAGQHSPRVRDQRLTFGVLTDAFALLRAGGTANGCLTRLRGPMPSLTQPALYLRAFATV